MTAAELETALRAVWTELLGVPAVGLDEDFFALGGSSLMAVRMLAMLSERLDRELPIQVLLQARTVRELAAAILAHDPAAEQEEGDI